MPTLFPCASKSLCLDDANPFANLSSEASDGPTFVGLSFGLWPFKPPLGANWRVSSCLGVCESQVSASEAFFCAARNELECLNPDRGTPPQYPLPRFPGPPGFGPILPPTTGGFIYGNTARIVSCNCPDGLLFSVFVPANRFTAYNQPQADQIADSWGQQEAVRLRFCLSDLPAFACGGRPYSQTVTATGLSLFPALFSTDFHQTPLTFAIVEGDLPPGLVLVTTGPNTCAIIGTPTSGGNTFMLRATGTDGSFMDKVYEVEVQSIGTSSPLPAATLNVAYSQVIDGSSIPGASGTWTVSAGDLPPGLTMNDATSTLEGTPTLSGDYTFTLKFTTDEASCEKEFTLSVPHVCIINTASPLADGDYGVAYAPVQLTIDLPDPVSNWQITSGALPTGMTLSAGGVISGTPTGFGNFSFTVKATVSASVFCSKTFALFIDCAADISEAIWTDSSLDNYAVPFADALDIAAGIGGSWSGGLTVAQPIQGTSAKTTFCNSGTAYLITVTIPWTIAGSVLFQTEPPDVFECHLAINGGIVDTVSRSPYTGPFTDVVLTGTIPATAPVTVEIRIGAIVIFPDPVVTVSSNGALTVTPLNHP